MFSHFKYPLIAFIAAFVLTMAGLLLKGLGVSGGSFLISTMAMAQGISLVWMIVLLFRRR